MGVGVGSGVGSPLGVAVGRIVGLGVGKLEGGSVGKGVPGVGAKSRWETAWFRWVTVWAGTWAAASEDSSVMALGVQSVQARALL